VDKKRSQCEVYQEDISINTMSCFAFLEEELQKGKKWKGKRKKGKCRMVT
jgi:hypothetical protein